ESRTDNWLLRLLRRGSLPRNARAGVTCFAQRDSDRLFPALHFSTLPATARLQFAVLIFVHDFLYFSTAFATARCLLLCWHVLILLPAHCKRRSERVSDTD